KLFNIKDYSSLPPNVILQDWAPQLEILSRSDVMVNHGGFGTVKECILMGVPMVVLPIRNFRDHFICGERVVYHGLGVCSDLAEVSSDELMRLIDCVLKNQSYRHRVKLMREKFKRQDGLELAVKIIENTIAGSIEPGDFEM